MKSITNNLSILQWLFAGVIFVIVDKVNDKYFKNRASNLQEMTFNDKYVQTIMAQDNLGEQKELAKYFACLSIQPEVKKGWIQYYQLKQAEFDRNAHSIDSLKAKYLALAYRNDSLRKDLSDLDNFELRQINEKLSYKENQQIAKTPSISNTDINTKARRIYIQYTEQVKDTAISYQKLFNEAKWKAPGIEVVRDLKTSSIRYFHQDDIQLANEIQTIIDKPKIRTQFIPGLESKVPTGQLEIWITNDINK